jgi:hypothetical protein
VPPKNDIDFFKKNLAKISLLNHHIMKKEKKKEYLPLFPNQKNPPKK